VADGVSVFECDLIFCKMMRFLYSCLWANFNVCDEGSEVKPGKPRKSKASKRRKRLDEMRSKLLEELMLVLFNLHDLNQNGVLEEDELVQLNSKVAMLHYGRDTDVAAVKAKYRALFREKLNADGQPVPYSVFRQYVLQVLDSLDPDPLAQEMIVEQFAAEAQSARAVFHVDSFASSSDQVFLSKISMPSFQLLRDDLHHPCSSPMSSGNLHHPCSTPKTSGNYVEIPCNMPSNQSWSPAPNMGQPQQLPCRITATVASPLHTTVASPAVLRTAACYGGA